MKLGICLVVATRILLMGAIFLKISTYFRSKGSFIVIVRTAIQD